MDHSLMAIRYAVASGLWSATATWDGGTLPASGDDVYANGFTVSIDQSITVNSLRKTTNATPGIAGGGNFNVTASVTITITDGIQSSHSATNTSAVLNISTGTPTVTVNGNIAGGAGASRRGITVSVAADVTINGDLTGGTGGGSVGLLLSGAATVTINGSVTGGGVASTYGINGTSSSSRLTIVGPVVMGGSADSAFGVYSSGVVRLDADLQFGSGGCPPVQTVGTKPMFVRGGSNLAFTAPSDDNWPLATGADISLVESGGGGVAPKRFLNVAGVATAIQ
jgi:hypothetical protein